MNIDLPSVIAQTESGTNDFRLRFESGLYAEWTVRPTSFVRQQICATIMRLNYCSLDTAEMIACTSWGRYQILGENLYDPSCCDVKSNVFQFAGTAPAQLLAFNDFLERRHVDFTLTDILMDSDKRQKFIAAYNGPGAVDAYWLRMKDAIKSLGGPTVLVGDQA